MSTLAREILGYWEQNPSGCDSLVGITQFWLPPRGVRATSKDIEVALDELVALDLVVKTAQPDGSLVYSMHRHLKQASPINNERSS